MPRKRAGMRLPPAHKKLRRNDQTEKSSSSQDNLEVPAARTPPKTAALQSVQSAELRESAASAPHPQRDGPMPARHAGRQDFIENPRLEVRLVPLTCSEAASAVRPQRDGPMPARAVRSRDFTQNRRRVARLAPVSCFGVGPQGFQDTSDDK